MNQQLSLLARSLSCLPAFAVAIDVAGSGSPTLRTVALSGEPAPGTAESFTSLSYVVINTNGRAVLRAQISGNSDGPCDEFGDPIPEQGIWSEGAGALQLVARRGDHAPGAEPLVTFNSFDAPLLNGIGNTAFLGFLTGVEADGDCANADNNVGVWVQGDGELVLVALAGSSAPGTPDGVVFDNFTNVRMNAAARTAFSAFLEGAGVDTTNNRGIWSDSGGSLALVARSGAQAPDTDPGVNFDWFGSGSPVINASGRTAFRAALVGPGVDDSNSYGIWADTSGVLALAARAGTAAPGTGEGVAFQWLGGPRLNDAGHLAFRATLTGPGVNASNNVGIWSNASGALTLVARTGSTAPGTLDNFIDLDEPALNSAGQVAFRGSTGPGASGIWSQEPDGLALVARIGDPAPGTGVSFGGFGQPAVNGAGRTAFWAVVSGSRVNGSNDTGLWAHDPTGELTLIVREGNAIEVAPGDTRTVTWLSIVVGAAEGGRSTGFNDASQTAFGSSFTDGSSGVFVASFCPLADLTGDCYVGTSDLLQLLEEWGPCPPAGECPADLDGDGIVSTADLLILLAAWN